MFYGIQPEDQTFQNLLVIEYSEKENTDDAEYKVELEKVKIILKNPKYEELMRGGNSKDGNSKHDNNLKPIEDLPMGQQK